MSYFIKYLDPVESLMSKDLFVQVKDLISFDSVFYQPSAFRKVRKEYRKCTKIGTTKDGVLFYSGLIPRIMKFCEKKELILRLLDYNPAIENVQEPKLPKGMILRDFQTNLIHDFWLAGRGVLKAPTGTGKTILGLSLIASIGDLDQVLWLCHTKDLMYQTVEEAVKFFGKNKVGMMGDGNLKTDKFLTIATRQTFKSYADDLGTSYDFVVTDETHHVGSLDSEYGTILKKVFAPFRLGLTATLPTSEEALLSMEALIGPLIGEYSINDGIEEGIMAPPRIKIIKIPVSQSVKELRNYQDVYEAGIVRRLDRNKIIVDLVAKHTKLGDSVLIVVNKITHGELILNLLDHSDIEALFIRGITDSPEREIAKKSLDSKKIKCIIATTVWKEGISIPSLNVIINAAGGKSEIATLQSIGRGTRKPEGKTEVVIYDFFDQSHHYLVDHFGSRISLYSDNGWI